MLLIYRSPLSNTLILFFIVHILLSNSNSNANQKYFSGFCADSFNQCQHVCIDNPTNHRQFYCTCRSGYFVQNDGFSCKKTPPKNLEMNYEINSETVDVKTEKYGHRISDVIKKSTKKLVTREKRYTEGKSKTIKPIKSLPKGRCTDNSCKNGGVCQTMKSNSRNDFLISCLCRLGFEGQFCERTTTGVKFPKFLNGYLAFPEQILNELNFRLSLFVRPTNDSLADVVLAFKQSMRKNSFILGVEKNHFILKIEMSRSTRYFKHQTKIENSRNKWYKIEIERKDNFSKLSVNNEDSLIPPIESNYEDEKYIESKAENNVPSNSFICDNCLYLGGHPQLLRVVKKNINLFDSIENSYIGCMRNLVINEVEIDMRRMPFYGKAVDGLGIEDCSIGLCQESTDFKKCKNNGDCQVSNNFVPTCFCKFGFVGPYCEKETNIQMLAFNGESYANYNGLIGTSKPQNDIFIKFKPDSDTGLLLYQGYSSDKRGDFLALYLINGYPMVSYDLGSGTITMRGLKSLNLGEWHTMRFYRKGREGTLIIDYGEKVVGYSPGSQLQLTMKQNLQLGGVDSFDNVSAYLSIRKSFKGCIHMVIMDNRKINLIEDIIHENSRNLQNCDSHQCGNIRKICWPVGDCIPISERYLCSCPLGYIEDKCQTKIETFNIRQPSFNGSSYLAYNSTSLLKRFQSPNFNFRIKINLKAFQQKSVLMKMITKSEVTVNQYFSLVINSRNGIDVNIDNGILIKANIIDNLPVHSDHTINIKRNERMITFIVNNSHIRTVELQHQNLFDYGFSKLFIGGLDMPTSIRFNLPIQSGIVGCILEFGFDNQKFHVINASDGRSVADCNS